MTYKRVRPGVYEVRDARFFMHGMQGYWKLEQIIEDTVGQWKPQRFELSLISR